MSYIIMNSVEVYEKAVEAIALQTEIRDKRIKLCVLKHQRWMNKRWLHRVLNRPPVTYEQAENDLMSGWGCYQVGEARVDYRENCRRLKQIRDAALQADVGSKMIVHINVAALFKMPA